MMGTVGTTATYYNINSIYIEANFCPHFVPTIKNISYKIVPTLSPLCPQYPIYLTKRSGDNSKQLRQAIYCPHIFSVCPQLLFTMGLASAVPTVPTVPTKIIGGQYIFKMVKNVFTIKPSHCYCQVTFICLYTIYKIFTFVLPYAYRPFMQTAKNA